MFVYCLNNPANIEDSDGEFAFALLAFPVAIKLAIGNGAVIGAIYTGYTIRTYARHGVQKSRIKHNKSISDGMEDRIPNDKLNPPKKKGDASLVKLINIQ